MALVKWIKISTDIFNDEKIQVIETMPEGKTIICIWFKLLCLAGRTNLCGWICMADKIPYTETMLAAIFREPEATVRLALKTFENFGMIEYSDSGVIGISNWEKHQAVEGLDEVRAKGRERTAKWRANKMKVLTEGKCDVTRDVTVTSNCSISNSISNSISSSLSYIEGNIDIKKEKDKERERKQQKSQVADYVSMTEEERQKLVDEFGEENTKEIIEILNNYKGANGKTYKSDYLAIRNWVIKRWKEEHREGRPPAKSFKQQEHDDFMAYAEEMAKKVRYVP